MATMSEATLPPNNRLLVIDDNQAIHTDFRKILQPAEAGLAGLEAAGAALFDESPRPVAAARFELDCALSGEEGLARVQTATAQGRPYAVAFVDVRMAPGWNGVETTARICRHDADIQIVICTAYSDYSWEEMIATLGQSDRLVILKKPFDPVEVKQLAHALTEKWGLAQTARARMDQLERMVVARTHELSAANARLKTEMAERAQAEEALRQAQKMEAVGQLAGGIAHDFNNLLTIIRGYVECLTLDLQPTGQTREALGEIDAAAARAAKLTSQLLMFSRKKKMQPERLDLNAVIDQLGSMLRRLLGEDISVVIQTGDVPLTIHADPVMMEMVLLNLAVNARDAMPRGGRLTIRSEPLELKAPEARGGAPAPPGWYAYVGVEDTGSGIAPEVLPHLFEPFFTTKGVGKGTGLGLASAYGIVKQHGGWIDAENQTEGGARFKIYLPLTAARPGAESAPRSKPPLATGNETILLVEDDRALRRLARTVLQRHGYRVLEAASGVEALPVWEQHSAEIQLVLTDMVMPGGVSGRELGEQLRARKPELKIIYTSGYSPDAFRGDLGRNAGESFLAKPYHTDDLMRTLRRTLDGRPHTPDRLEAAAVQADPDTR
jgi:signal transduction histidine kinase